MAHSNQREFVESLAAKGKLKIGIYFAGICHKEISVLPETDDSTLKSYLEFAVGGIEIPVDKLGDALINGITGRAGMRHRISELGSIPPELIPGLAKDMLPPDSNVLFKLAKEANENLERFCESNGIDFKEAPGDAFESEDSASAVGDVDDGSSDASGIRRKADERNTQ